jgi:hypothetical protein
MYQSPYQRNYVPYGTNYSMPNYPQPQYAPQPMPTQQAQPQQSQMQYEIPIQDVRFVTSEEAKAYIVMPNSKALLIDKSGTAYLKSADAMGQSQTQYFRFEPINADGTPIKPQEVKPEFDAEEFSKRFVTIEQYEALVQQISDLKKSIGNNRNNNIKTSNG